MNYVPQPAFYSKCNGAPFPTNSDAVSEDELSPRSSVNFNNTWKYNFIPHTHDHGVMLDRQRGILSYLLLRTINLYYNYQSLIIFMRDQPRGFYS
jgi:hypothetical protein